MYLKHCKFRTKKKDFAEKTAKEFTALEWTEFVVIYKEWYCIADVERKLWICNPNITKVCKWERHTAWWFWWSHEKLH